MSLIGRYFTDHPRSVGETYLEHQRFAARTGLTLIAAGAACLVHALAPSLCVTTASRTVSRLHADMTNRGPGAPSNDAAASSGRAAALAPGMALTLAGAAVAVGVAGLWPVPAVFAALLVGMALAAVVRGPAIEAGGAWACTGLLRLGVVLLGARIDLQLISELGWSAVALTLGALVASLALGMGVARLCGVKGRGAVLTASSVAICGASATLALASVMPKRPDADRQTTQIIVLVTLIGSAGMMLYPMIAARLGFDSVETSVFLGGALHELAQAAGAGAAVSPDVGVMAVAVKLIRVACLAPIGFALAFWLQQRRVSDGKANLAPAPWFLVGFVLVAGARSLGLIPDAAADLMAATAQICLVAAMVGLGLKMTPARIISGDPRLALVILVQSALLAGILLAALTWGHGHFGV